MPCEPAKKGVNVTEQIISYLIELLVVSPLSQSGLDAAGIVKSPRAFISVTGNFKQHGLSMEMYSETIKDIYHKLYRA